MDGWIRLHRKILFSAVWEDVNALRVFVWALLRANHTTRTIRFNGEEIDLQPGQFVSGRFAGARECRMKPSTFRNACDRLSKTQNLDIKSDNQKSVYTVVKWEDYQTGEAQEDNTEDNGRTTGGQREDTDKNERMKEYNTSKKDSCAVTIFLPTNRSGEEYPIPENLTTEFQELYPAVDVVAQLRAMRGWLLANQGKRKTSRGMMAFVNSWLKREQDKPRPNNGQQHTHTPDVGKRNYCPDAESNDRLKDILGA